MSFKVKIYQINAQRAGTELFFIDNPKPEISWQVESDSPDFCQSAYRINAVNDGGETVWDSGEVKSGCSRWVSWGGAALKSSEIITLQLQVADASGSWSEFSDPVRFVLGRQQSCQWGGAHWLAYAKHNNTTSSPLPYFRKDFTVKPGLKKAICWCF